MIRVLLALALALTLTCGCTSAAGISAATVLPRGAQVQAQTHIAGYRHAVAVAYMLGRPYVGVALLGTKRDHLVWSSPLPARPRRLLSPGPTGVFVVWTASGSNAGAVSAYRLHAGNVTWALGIGKGHAMPASSISAAKNRLTVIAPDISHVGSIAYRYRTRLHWDGASYSLQATVHEPAMAPSAYPRPNGVVHLKDGDTVLMKLETAWTLSQQEYGLMNRPVLDSDSGMVFVWPGLVDDTFTMSNTLIPLTVAFLAPNGTILFTQDMKELDSTTPYGPDPSHCATQVPGQCYQFAIEMNKGFFADSGIHVGDKVVLSLPCSSFQGFHSASVRCYS